MALFFKIFKYIFSTRILFISLLMFVIKPSNFFGIGLFHCDNPIDKSRQGSSPVIVEATFSCSRICPPSCPGTTLGQVLLYGKWHHLAGSSIFCNWPCVVVSARKKFGPSPNYCIDLLYQTKIFLSFKSHSIRSYVLNGAHIRLFFLLTGSVSVK